MQMIIRIAQNTDLLVNIQLSVQKYQRFCTKSWKSVKVEKLMLPFQNIYYMLLPQHHGYNSRLYLWII